MKFLDTSALKLNKESGIDFISLLSPSLEELSQKYHLTANFLCEVEANGSDLRMIACQNLPLSFFRSHNQNLKETIEDCFSRYPKPHVHSLKDSLVTVLCKLTSCTFSHKIIFIPILARAVRFVFIGFLADEEVKDVPDGLDEDLLNIINPVSLLVIGNSLELRLKTLESYVKEVGHDIASAVQATVAKLGLIYRGYFKGESILKKVKEAEEEIMSAYRVAENLGIVVDPDYNIQEGTDFNLIDAIKTAIEQYRSEANEHHVEIREDYDGISFIEVWGDRKAIESAVGQYLFNAIKYARGSSYVTVAAFQTHTEAYIRVTDLGIPLRKEEEEHIWDFGFRGQDALERHVNGSGIGLYTVKKIIKAHGGIVAAESSNKDPRIVTFSFKLLKKDILEKTKFL